MFKKRPDIYEMLDTLSLEMKEELLEYLKADIAAIKSAPKKTYLEEQWAEIMRLIETLKYEPYIDDQIEISDIWVICEDMIKSGRLKNEPWHIRRSVIESIVEGEYYDEFGVHDPLEELFHALMLTAEEKIEIADMIFETGSDYTTKDGALLYKESGRLDKYIAYVENRLYKNEAPYMEVIDYYKDNDREKAIEIAELGMKKCKDDQTELTIFLISSAREDGDKEKEVSLLKSVRTRKAIEFKSIGGEG